MSGADTLLAYEADYEGLILRRLAPSQFTQTPRWVALWKGLAAAFQAAEDELFDLHVSTSLDLATGAALDQWAEIVGEGRGGLDDTWLRQFIRARILANLSTSSEDELIRIYGILTAGSARILTAYPAAFTLSTVRGDYMPADIRRRVARFMDEIKPAGIEMVLMEAVGGFQGFAGDPSSGMLGTALLARHVRAV